MSDEQTLRARHADLLRRYQDADGDLERLAVVEELDRLAPVIREMDARAAEVRREERARARRDSPARRRRTWVDGRARAAGEENG